MTPFRGTQAELADELSRFAQECGRKPTRLVSPYFAGHVEGEEHAYDVAASLVRTAIITEEPTP